MTPIDPTAPTPPASTVATTALPPDSAAFAPIWAVIPAGGAGTRLWPLSRAGRPKFLLNLLGPRSLLQTTGDRLAPLTTPERTLVVCGPQHAAEVARQLPHVPAANVLVEPSPRGSGPAIGLAAAIVTRHEPDAVMGSFAADHDVRDRHAFARAVRAAVGAAREGWLVTIGLTPTRPETGYGYIERSDEVVGASPDGTAYCAASFVEKPDLARAETYVESGRFLWNAGMFVWRAQALLDEMARLQPDLHAGLLRIAAAWGTPDQDAVVAATWAGLPVSTIDQGVMEQAARVAVVPSSMGWSDIGDWHGLARLADHDAEGNTLPPAVVQVASTNSAVWSTTDRLVALVGVDNLVVVDTPDGLLVADRSRAQEVRRIVELLKERRRDDLT